MSVRTLDRAGSVDRGLRRALVVTVAVALAVLVAGGVHAGHRTSQRIRPRIEEGFGWIKTVAGGRKLRYRGRERNRAWFLLAAATYNLLRITTLDTATA